MNPDQIEAFHPLSTAVRRLFHKLGYVVAALHQDIGITVGMRGVLESVIAGPHTVPEMARARSRSRQHVQALVNALMERGLVETRPNPAHAVSSLIVGTEAGRRLFVDMRRREDEVLARVAFDAGAADIRAATRLLSALIGALEAEASSDSNDT